MIKIFKREKTMKYRKCIHLSFWNRCKHFIGLLPLQKGQWVSWVDAQSNPCKSRVQRANSNWHVTTLYPGNRYNWAYHTCEPLSYLAERYHVTLTRISVSMVAIGALAAVGIVVLTLCMG